MFTHPPHQITVKRRGNDMKRIINILMNEAHQTAIEHGWWDAERLPLECIALMHAELSEAVEAIRDGNPPDKYLPQHDALTVELADCIIRIFDFAAANKLDLADALLDKMEYNQGREYRHGGKVA